jgi:hypothetical protein
MMIIIIIIIIGGVPDGGEYGGCGSTGALYFARYSLTR